MQLGRNTWMKEILAFFTSHPEREYWLGDIPLTETAAVGRAGWIAGTASRAAHHPPALDVFEGQHSVPCIVRRPDVVGGRPLPSVFFLDGGPLPPLPESKDASRGEEQLCEQLWKLAYMAADAKLSLRNYLARAFAQT